MALRATKSDENWLARRYDAIQRRVAEVVTALEKLRPLGSLIRTALIGPMLESRLSARQGDSS